MASEEQDLADAALAPGGRRQRPPATIDLTATDVPDEPAAPPEQAHPGAAEPEPSIVAGAAPEPESPIAPAAAARPADGAPGAQDHGDGQAGNGSTPTQSERAERKPRRRPVTAFLVAGAAVALLATGLQRELGLASRDTASDMLAARIAGLELELRDLANRPPSAADAAVGDLGARIDGIDRQLAGLEAGLAHRDGDAAPALAGAPPDPELANRVVATETAVRGLTADIADLRARLDRVAEQAAKPAAAPIDQGPIDALTARVGALESAIRTTDARSTAAASAAASAADAPVRVALVALELRVAVERGAPFASELAAARPLIQDKSVIDALEPVAASGVPTPQALSRDLSDLAPAMMRTAGKPAHEGGVLERLQANASRLVHIRPIEEAPGDDPSTVIVRAEVKATRGDIAGALAELGTLPADIRAPAAAWIRSAQLRIAAVEAARNFSVGAFAALGKPAP